MRVKPIVLAPAFYHQEALIKARQKIIGDPKYLYLGINSFYVWDIEIAKNSEKKEEWVSLDNGEVVGYLAAKVDRETRNVVEMSIINFKESRSFNIDLITFVRKLKQYRVITWAVVKGNPIEASYDKIAKRFGGRVVGEFTKNTRLTDGKLYNVKWYEIVNPNYNEHHE